jgi:spermidine/putrescine transport system ATP-binding protein
MQLELKALQRKVSITFVYVTHDQGEALALSDRIAVINDGKILQVGTPSEIYDSPENRFVADFIGTSNFLEGTLISENEIALTTEPPLKIVNAPNNDLPLNTTVTVAIRPERFNLRATPTPDAQNFLCGVIQDESYLGTTLQYTVQTDYPTPLIAHQQNTGAKDTPCFQRGDTVYLQWTPENAIVLKAD